MIVRFTNLGQLPYSTDVVDAEGERIGVLVPVGGTVEIPDIDPYYLNQDKDLRNAVWVQQALSVEFVMELDDLLPPPHTTIISTPPYSIVNGAPSVVLVQAAPTTINLPSIADMGPFILYVKDANGDASEGTPITIVPDGAELIDGEAILVIDGPYASVTLLGTGSQWSIL